MDNAASVGVSKPIANLAEVIERLGKTKLLFRQCSLMLHQIAASHVFKCDETKLSARSVFTLALIQDGNDVGVSNPVEDRGLIAKLLPEQLLKFWIRSSQQMTVQSLNYDIAATVTIARNKHLGVTAGANPTSNLIAILEDCSM